MKVFVIFLVLVGFVGVAFAAPGFTSQQIYDFSDIIAVGEITFVNSTFSPTMNLYHIQVEKFLKNPQDSNEILAVGSKTVSIRAGNEVFDVGDRALFFLTDDIASMYPNYSEIYEMSTVSQRMDPNWDKCNIFEKNIPPEHWVFGGRNNHLQVSQENKTGDFVTGKKITISYDIFNHEPVTKKVDFGKMVKNIDEPESLYEFTETAYRILEPCTVYETVFWGFTPSKSANYLAEFYDLKGRTMGITIHVESDTSFSDMAPLKQFDSGIPFDKIQCKQNLVLLQKYDGSPACVTESTKQKLIERGWTDTLSSLDSTMQTDTKSKSNSKTKTPYTIIIYDTGDNHGRQLSIDPHNVIMDLEEGNTVMFVNNGSTAVNIFDSLKGTWSFANVEPLSKRELIINATGFHEFLVQDSRKGETGIIVALSENTNSLPVETRAKMAQSIITNDFDKGVGLIGVGSGGAEPGISIDIDKKFQNKYSLEFYYDRYTAMIPFDVPITIDFREPFRLLE